MHLFGYLSSKNDINNLVRAVTEVYRQAGLKYLAWEVERTLGGQGVAAVGTVVTGLSAESTGRGVAGRGYSP